MTNEEIQKLDEAHRLLLEQAGLGHALTMFPADILVAVRTAINVRDSFASLAVLGVPSSRAVTGTDAG